MPVLVGFTLRTHTIDDDKDDDTGIFVEVHDKNGNQIANIGNAELSHDGSTHYNPGDIRQFHIDPLREDIPKDDCLPCAWRMGIKASGPGLNILTGGGNDRWTFDAYLFVVFSDDTSSGGNKLGQTLESNDEMLVWDDYSNTGNIAG